MNNEAIGRANLKAVQVLKALCGELPSQEEREILAKFTGWGAIADVFDTSKCGWRQDVRNELQQLLTKEEYAEAQASTFNAHYTSFPVIKAMWDGLVALGLKGKINALEPGCGIGRFIECTPPDLNVDWVGIERDIVPAAIAQAIHPQAKIVNQKFQDFNCEGLFDLAIGNIPFGDINIGSLKIHNFFIKKSIDLVRPGGFVVLISTSGTLDARGNTFRELISNSVNLVGAIRLPNTAFLEENTEITTDILVFKKEPCENKTWTASPEIQLIAYGKGFNEAFAHLLPDRLKPENWIKNAYANMSEIGSKLGQLKHLPINGYYLFNPSMLLGELAECELYGGRISLNGDDRDLSQEIVCCFKEFKSSYEPAKTQQIVMADPKVACIPHNHFFWKNEKLWQKGAFKVVEILKEVEKIDSMLKLWGDLEKLLRAQQGQDENRLIECRGDLNDSYDRWITKYGYLNSQSNIKVCCTDPRYYLLMALEVPAQQCGYSFKELLKSAQHFSKADIFTKRTASPQIAPESADSIEDAIVLSLNQFGAIDTDFLIKLRGEGVIDELEKSSSAFFDTSTSTWVSAEEYLSGNVREKLAIAQLAGNLKNIEALELIQPLYLLPKASVETRAEVAIRIGASKCEPDISISYEVLFGSTWVPSGCYGHFASYLMGSPVDITYIPSPIDYYRIEAHHTIARSAANKKEWGAPRADFLTLLEMGLSQKDPVIKDIVDKKTVVNIQETENARAKMQEIKRKFADWLYLDVDRAEDITRLYNEQFNCLVDRKYRGEVLTLADANPEFKWRSHQKNAIWRSLQKDATLLGHSVGAGKTGVLVATAMEARRLGLAKKPMIVVLNSTISGVESEFRRIYPFAKLKVSTQHSLSPDNRKRFCTEIAMGDWDCVIITHTQFQTGISLSPESTLVFLEEELEIANQFLEEALKNGDRKSIKQIAKARERIKSKIAAAIEAANQQKDEVVFLEQTGVDLICIDEAHVFKNLPYHTRQTNVAGLPNTSFYRRKNGGTLTSRSFDAYMKVRWMLSTNKKVIFATGTPVSNTLVESWTMMRYLAAPMLKKAGIESFDSCLSTFFNLTTTAEQTPTGYKTRTRCSGIVNLPEFMSLWRSFVDVQSAKMLNLPAPEHEIIPVECEASTQQAAYMDYLIERLYDIQKRLVTPDEDNALKVYTDARAAFGIDIRLRWKDGKDFLYGKINTCATNVYRIWKLGAITKAAQAIFCDFSTPKKNKKANKGDKTFDAYTCLRDVLIGLGIPAKEIAFIHDAETDSARKKLIGKVNSGEIRVILGSTQKLGTGVNIQTRLLAIHDMDCPWRPSDIEQRSGRILRQGNLFDKVFIFRYVTQGVEGKPGFDSYIWGVILRKLESFQVLMSGDAPGRTTDDVDPFVASATTMMAIASGDERIKRKIDVDRLVNSLLIQQKGHEQQRYQNTVAFDKALKRIDLLCDSIKAMQEDLAKIETAEPKLFLAGQEIANNTKNAEEIGKSIAEKINLLRAIKDNRSELNKFNPVIGKFAGFQLLAELDRNTVNLILKGQANYVLPSSVRSKIVESLTIENFCKRIQVKLDSTIEELRLTRADFGSLDKARSTPFLGAEELKQLLDEQAELEEQLNPAEVPQQQDSPTESQKEPEPKESAEPAETYEFWQTDSPCVYEGVKDDMIENLKELLEQSPNWADRVMSSCEAVLPKLASIDIKVFAGDDDLEDTDDEIDPCEFKDFDDDSDFFDDDDDDDFSNDFDDDSNFFDDNDDEEPVASSLNDFDNDDDFFDD
jgi:N12 class adenine-specific DNA methylase